jgi:hypothetical protein
MGYLVLLGGDPSRFENVRYFMSGMSKNGDYISNKCYAYGELKSCRLSIIQMDMSIY